MTEVMHASFGPMPLSKNPEIGQRVRIGIRYNGSWRPLCWLRIGKDGSIYVGMLTNEPTIARRWSAPVSSREHTILYRDAQKIPLPRKGSRVSFKVDGNIHLGDENLRGWPLNSLERARQLCMMLFVHPSRYRTPVKKSKNDFDIEIRDYSVSENQPLYGALIVAPATMNFEGLPRRLPSMKTGVRVAFKCDELRKCPDLWVIVLLGHGVTGEWPSLPHITCLSKK